MNIKPATRQGVKPLIGLYSESGCGKTFSSLLIARGLVGPSGKIVMIDTESGRGSLYADVIPGGYHVLEMTEPFSPDNYVAAIKQAEEFGAGVIVIDSASHEWEGLGGVLAIAAENEAAGKKGLLVWKAPKMAHAKFMLKLLQTSTPLIVCLRAKFKSRQKGGQVIKDENTSPIQAEDFIFEMMAHAEILPDHSINLTKCSHPSLRDCFPKKGQPISIETGEAIARWCANPGTSSNSPQQKTGVPSPKAGGGSSTPVTGPLSATPEQRQKMLSAFQHAGIDEDVLKSFAEHKAWLAPFDELGEWPLEKTPTKMAQMTALIEEVNQWRAGATA